MSKIIRLCFVNGWTAIETEDHYIVLMWRKVSLLNKKIHQRVQLIPTDEIIDRWGEYTVIKKVPNYTEFTEA